VPLLAALALIAASGCGDRPESYDAPMDGDPIAVGLSGSLAIVDRPLDRVVMVTSPAQGALSTSAFGVGKNVVSALAAPTNDKLFVLSRGTQPRRNPEDERPSLSVIDGGLTPRAIASYTLTDPLQGLSIDPLGEWAVVYDAGGVVVNPNELIFVDLKTAGAAPVPKTIRSFGGRPERLTFTSELLTKDGPRRFLIVETSQDVTLIDLVDLERDEVTLPLSQTTTGRPGQPLEVAFHDGDPADDGDARIAIRLANDSNVMVVELDTPPEGSVKPFQAVINVADVGGTPSSIGFVRTDGGLRLAALVPERRQAALIDPTSFVVESVEFDQPFSRLARVTDELSARPDTSDVALLWSDSTRAIAFWSLGTTSGTPFRSVDPYPIEISVGTVKNVPGDTFAHLKILESTSAAEFYVLDLDKRQSFPMLTDNAGFELTIAPDGLRGWALRPGTARFASIDFSDLHPRSLEVERPVSGVFDVARPDGGRTLIALHSVGSKGGRGGPPGLGATVLDGVNPDTASSVFYGGLLLGGLR
jgi:hypothetical protein